MIGKIYQLAKILFPEKKMWFGSLWKKLPQYVFRRAFLIEAFFGKIGTRKIVEATTKTG